MKIKYIYLIFLTPSFLINYFTLTLFDSDHDLGKFSTLLVCFFNLSNIVLIFLFHKYDIKKFFLIILNFLLIILIFDFSYQAYLKKNSFQVQDKELGWILNKSIQKKFISKSKQGRKYEIEYNSANELGFRYINNKNNFEKTILIIGDSFTVGPYASNKEMYFSWIQEAFKNENLNYNWYVMGSAGWGTLQQYMHLKKKINFINPDIVIHQFCTTNDFINNSIEIEENTFLRSQHFFRPYLVNGKIFYKNNFIHKIYKFFYSKSFIFKTLDNLITNYQYRENVSYFKKNYTDSMYKRSIITTDKIIKKIKNLIGDNKTYFLINCYDRINTFDKDLKEIIDINNIHSSDLPLIKLKYADEKKEDIFVFDGGHLNDLGNKIYGTAIGDEILKIIQ